MSESRKDAEAQGARPGETPETPPAAEKARADEPRPRYVFKILPADPKNSFDFEDVADK